MEDVIVGGYSDCFSVLCCVILMSSSVSSLFSTIVDANTYSVAFDLTAWVQLTLVNTTGGCFASLEPELFTAGRSAVYNTGCPLSMLHYSSPSLFWPDPVGNWRYHCYRFHSLLDAAPYLVQDRPQVQGRE